MNKPIEVSKTTYLEIENSLEEHWESLPWKRIFKEGRRGSYEEVIKRFDLECLDKGDDVVVRLVSKDNPEHIPYSETFYKYL